MGEIVDLAAKLDLIEKAGSWYTVEDTRLQGRDAVKEYLKGNPDVAGVLEQKIRENAHKLLSPQARAAAISAGRAVNISADDFEG